jgi:hypothetical protein
VQMLRIFFAAAMTMAIAIAIAIAVPSLGYTQEKTNVSSADIAERGLKVSDFPRWKELKPDIYFYEGLHSPDPDGHIVNTGSLIVVTTGGVAVLDGQGDVAQTQTMVDTTGTFRRMASWMTPQPCNATWRERARRSCMSLRRASVCTTLASLACRTSPSRARSPCHAKPSNRQIGGRTRILPCGLRSSRVRSSGCTRHSTASCSKASVG